MSLITSLTRVWLTRSLRPFHFTSQFDPVLPVEDALHPGLYIHIPFCRTLCSFCPYCKVVYSAALASAYVDALKREIVLVGSRFPARKTVTSLYFGGGTPALLAGEIAGLMDTVRRYFTITEGVGLELHPLDVTVETLQTLKAAGVTRISIGIQSFSDAYLDILGRGTQNWAPMFAALRAVPFETVSMDFIFALPGQTIDSVREDIETAFANGANHVALYPFIDFTYTSRSFPKMPEGEKKRLLSDITSYCAEQGYVRDSIWTFA
ncbi:MAG: radical SAM protein, partial [Oscillibacter sp.]